MSELGLWWSLLGEGMLASIAVGVTLPLLGALLFLRKSALLGLAVPQFSAAGLAFGLFLMPFFPAVQAVFLEHGHPPMLYSFAFAAIAAMVSLIVFAALASRGNTRVDGMIAVGFVFALSATIIFLAAAPAGNNLAETLLRGEIILLDQHGLLVVLAISGLVLAGLTAYWRLFLVAAFDKEHAVALGHSVQKAEVLQVVLVGAAVGGGVVTIGPVLVFALLFVPPLVAHPGLPGIRGFLLRTVSCGLASVLLSWPVSFVLDVPYGPSVALVACFVGLVMRFFR